ncbi:MAG: glycerol-3-phosphate 1-O-acyltransferase PlsY [Bacteroidota bacterium]|nr:glycerol-3-phosphate 1-O-acyltransferase PlsY [Bacteroidota bacterium]
MTILYVVLLIAGAYLIGSIPTAIWIGRWFYGIDVREHGSGNAGTTNTIRVLGYKAGIPVFFFDIFKGWTAVQLAEIFPNVLPDADAMIYLKIGLTIAAVIGHVFPVYEGFRGGKGVATIAGAAIALYPLSFLIVLGIFALTLFLSHYVSLSSILAAIAFPFTVIFISGEHHVGLIVLSILVAVFIPITHIPNIRRLMKGEENKFLFRNKNPENPK